MNDKVFSSSEELCKWIVEELGPQFKRYVDQFIDDGIDGELLSQLEEEEMAGLVSDSEHRRALTQAVVDLMAFNTPADDFNNFSCPKDHIMNAVAQLDEWDIVTWLELLGEPYSAYGKAFFDNGVDGALLMMLSPEDFAELIPDPIQRRVVMEEVCNPTPTFLSAILQEKPLVRNNLKGGGNRRRSVVVNGPQSPNSDFNLKLKGLSLSDSQQVSAYFDEALEKSKKEDNLLPWLTANGYSHHWLTLQQNGCTWQILKSIPSIDHLHRLGVKSKNDATSLFMRIVELRDLEQIDDSDRHSNRSRAVSDASESSDISDIVAPDETPRFKTDWAVLAIARFLPEAEACDFLAQIWRSSTETGRQRLVNEHRNAVEKIIVAKMKAHQSQINGAPSEDLTSIARLAFALDVKVAAIFSEVSGQSYQLPRQLALELLDFGYSCDTTGFPLLHSEYANASDEDRGSIFHCFLLASLRAGANLSFQDLGAIGPRIDVVTQRGLTALDIIGEFLRRNSDETNAGVALTLHGLLQQYGFYRQSTSNPTPEESESITAYKAYEKKGRNAIMNVNWLKKKVRLALISFTFG